MRFSFFLSTVACLIGTQYVTEFKQKNTKVHSRASRSFSPFPFTSLFIF